MSMTDNSDPCSGCTGTPGTDRISVQDKAASQAKTKPPLRAVFMGTPDFAATILARLLETPVVSIEAVYAQPDRPAGRGRQLRLPPVKEFALRHDIPVHQPLNFRNTPEGNAAVEELAAYKPDVLLVAAYGLILPQRVLDIPISMPINVHASLLPKYRGAAPIQRAIMNGDTVTGVTIMRMEAGLDTGPILMQRAVAIGLQDSSATLHDELAREGAELLIAALERLSAGVLQALPQDESRASHAPKLSKEEALLDFSLDARALHARIRGLTPWPGAAMKLRRQGQEDLTVLAEPGIFPQRPEMLNCQQLSDSDGIHRQAGSIVGLCGNALLVGCSGGTYAFSSLRPAGKKSMDGKAFFNGYLSGFDEAYFVGVD